MKSPFGRRRRNTATSQANVPPSLASSQQSSSQNLFGGNGGNRNYRLRLPSRSSPRRKVKTMASGHNFWKVGAYKALLRRMDDGAFLLEEFSRLIAERASIEKKYASMLKHWGRKWEQHINQGPEAPEGTLRIAWKSLLIEADSISKVHYKNHANLKKVVAADVLRWKKDMYQKHLNTWKVTKQATDQFNQAQTPWAEELKTMNKCQKSYYAACANLEATEKRLEQAKRATGPKAQDEVAKWQTKLSRARKTKASTRQAYEDSIQRLHADKGRYKQDMKQAFIFCQDVEQRRQDFMKKTMRRYANTLAEHTPEHCQEMFQLIDGVNPDADMVRYRKHHGPDQALTVPSFIEWGARPAIEVIRSGDGDGTDDGILDDDTNMFPAGRVGKLSTAPLGDDSDHDELDDDDEDWDDDWTPPPAVTAVGKPVRALFDYDAEDDEELSFKAGDIITMVEDEDEQGWCSGIHVANGSSGLFPANYVEEIEIEGGETVLQQLATVQQSGKQYQNVPAADSEDHDGSYVEPAADENASPRANDMIDDIDQELASHPIFAKPSPEDSQSKLMGVMRRQSQTALITDGHPMMLGRSTGSRSSRSRLSLSSRSSLSKLPADRDMVPLIAAGRDEYQDQEI